ncbi:MAG: hypothetical protein ACTHJI_00360 [Leifsonia sp.]
MSRVAADAADVLTAAELTDIRVYEVAGRRLLPGEHVDSETDASENFQIQAGGDESHFETRARLTVTTADSELLADVSAIYTFAESLTVPREVAGEFVERVGIMSVYPFLREQIFATATRLGVSAPVMGLLRAGQITVELTPASDLAAPSLEPSHQDPRSN